MANKYLVSGKTDLSASASYSDTIDGTGGDGLPTSGDTLFILEGSQTVNAGLTALASVDLELCILGERFYGKFGDTGSPVSLLISNSADAELRVLGGSGYAYINAVGDGIDNALIDAVGGAKVFFTAGTLGVLKNVSGETQVQNGCDVTSVYRSGGVVDMGPDSTAATLVVATGGSGTIEREVTTATISGGRTKMAMKSSTAVGTLNVHGGTVEANYTGTVTAANVYGGTLTPSGAVKDQVITTANRFGGVLVEKAGQTSFTIGTENVYGGSKVTLPKTGSSPLDN